MGIINISNHHSLLLPITTIKHFHFTSTTSSSQDQPITQIHQNAIRHRPHRCLPRRCRLSNSLHSNHHRPIHQRSIRTLCKRPRRARRRQEERCFPPRQHPSRQQLQLPRHLFLPAVQLPGC